MAKGWVLPPPCNSLCCCHGRGSIESISEFSPSVTKWGQSPRFPGVSIGFYGAWRRFDKAYRGFCTASGDLGAEGLGVLGVLGVEGSGFRRLRVSVRA